MSNYVLITFRNGEKTAMTLELRPDVFLICKLRSGPKRAPGINSTSLAGTKRWTWLRACVQSFMNSLVQSTVHSKIGASIPSCVHIFFRSLVRSFTRSSFADPFALAVMRSLIYLLALSCVLESIRWCFASLLHVFVRLFAGVVHSIIRSFIHAFVCICCCRYKDRLDKGHSQGTRDTARAPHAATEQFGSNLRGARLQAGCRMWSSGLAPAPQCSRSP